MAVDIRNLRDLSEVKKCMNFHKKTQNNGDFLGDILLLI